MRRPAEAQAPAARRARDESEAVMDETERLGRLFDSQHQRLYRLACRLAGDREEARDLVQECFLRAARRVAALPTEAAAAEAWLVRTLVNLCRDRHRRVRVREAARPRLAAPAPGAPSPEAAAVARATVAAALARLAPRRRAVVALAELEERPTAEVARLLGLSRVTVRWHLSRARRELAEVLSETPKDAGPGPGEAGLEEP